MKILVYEADKIIPIEGLYEWLGDSGSIIFSNADQKIQHFDNREVIRLLESINFDTVIFYIPLSIQNQFVKLVNSQFHITEWQKDNTVKFSIEDIGLIGENALSRFFDKMRLILGFSPKKECPKELEDLLNEVVENPINPIEGIFLFDLQKHFFICKSTSNALLNNLNSVTSSLYSLININNVLNKIGYVLECGELKFFVFHLTNGMISFHVVPNLDSPILIGFVATKNQKIAQLAAFGEIEREKIVNFLKKMKNTV